MSSIVEDVCLNANLTEGQTINAVMNNPEQQSTLEVLLQDEVVIDGALDIQYIRTGKDEIQSYVDNYAKPQINEHTDSKKNEISVFVDNEEKEAKKNIDAYVDDEIKPDISDYVISKKKSLDEYADGKKDEISVFVENDVKPELEQIATDVERYTALAEENAINSENSAILAINYADKAGIDAIRASSEADRSEIEADRAEAEANRAKGYADSINPAQFAEKRQFAVVATLPAILEPDVFYFVHEV